MTRGGARRRADLPRSRTPVLLVIVAVVAVVITIAAGLLWDTTPGPGAAAQSGQQSGAADHASVDVSDLPIGHTLTCDDLVGAALRTALGGEPTERDGYVSGERVEIAPDVTDVAHEDSCTYGRGGLRARVWVFAAPVRRSQARGLVRELRREARCSFPERATDFGTPELVSLCRGTEEARSPGAMATLRGLFGDAWLSCQLADEGTSEPAVLLRRADRWCLHVATTLGAVP
jgi:hypothetical protein